MPSTYNEILSRLDLALGEPVPYAPSMPVRWEKLRSAAQLLFNATLNAPPSWSVRSWDLTVYDGTETYLVNVSNFSKDVLVETIDESDANHVPQPIARVSLGSQTLSQPTVYYGNHSAEGQKHNAASFAFYRQEGSIYVRVSPKPTQTATYRIWYDTVEPNTDALGNYFPLPQGEAYLINRAAASLLPFCQWPGLSPEEAAMRKRDLKEALALDLSEHGLEWRRMVSTDRQSRVTVLRGFDDASYLN